MPDTDPVREFLRAIGSKGGKQRAANMTAEERTKSAQEAVRAREKKKRDREAAEAREIKSK